MKRLALLAAVGALALASCGSSNRPAAIIDGQEIPKATFDALLKDFRNNKTFLTWNKSSGTYPDPGSDKTTSVQFADQILQQEVLNAMIAHEVKAKGITIDDAARTEGARQAKEQFGGGDGSSVPAADAVFNGFSQATKDRLTEERTNLVALAFSLSNQRVDDASLQTLYTANPSLFDQRCVRHILVSDQNEAQQIKDEIAKGATFEAMASANSIDTDTKDKGGDLGCVSRNTGFVQEFEDAVNSAPKGQVIGPVQTQYGYHLIEVYDIKPRTFTEAHDDVLQAALSKGFDAVRVQLLQVVKSAQITIDPRYGTWGGPNNPKIVLPVALTGGTTAPTTTAPPTAASDTTAVSDANGATSTTLAGSSAPTTAASAPSAPSVTSAPAGSSSSTG